VTDNAVMDTPSSEPRSDSGMTPFHFRTATLSRSGGRDHNEDACGCREGCWVLADGLGGHRGGAVAAELAVQTILHQAERLQASDPATLSAALGAAEQAIQQRQRADPRLSRMRTTLVLLCSDGRLACWAHIGDSRLYHLRDGRIRFQTRDHSVPQMLADAGEISPGQIRHHEDRNRLLRSLGNDRALPPTLADRPLRLCPGDAFLLCSDGLWEHVTEAEMALTLAAVADPESWLRAMVALLRPRAAPDHDNYSAIAVWVTAAACGP
jgi:PPM family protein phosphatase